MIAWKDRIYLYWILIAVVYYLNCYWMIQNCSSVSLRLYIKSVSVSQPGHWRILNSKRWNSFLNFNIIWSWGRWLADKKLMFNYWTSRVNTCKIAYCNWWKFSWLINSVVNIFNRRWRLYVCRCWYACESNLKCKWITLKRISEKTYALEILSLLFNR